MTKTAKTRKNIENELIKIAKQEDEKTKKIYSFMKRIDCRGNKLMFNYIPRDTDVVSTKIEIETSIDDIKKIDDVPVDVKLKFSLVHYGKRPEGECWCIFGYLEIESANLFCCYSDTYINYYKKTYILRDVLKLTVSGANLFVFETILKILELIPLLKFDKLEGKFITEKEIPYYDLFKFDNTEITDVQNCVICYENTKSKTPCNHAICFACNENISVKFDNDECPTRDCPMCRKDILYYHDE